jgi:hypothetical protein
MQISIAKEKSGNELTVKFTLSSGDFIIFKAEENIDNNFFFEMKCNIDDISIRNWLNCNIKPTER